VTGKKLRSDFVVEALAHGVGATFDGFIDTDFVDQNALPNAAVLLFCRCRELRIFKRAMSNKNWRN
jgi:hypothetical protein